MMEVALYHAKLLLLTEEIVFYHKKKNLLSVTDKAALSQKIRLFLTKIKIS